MRQSHIVLLATLFVLSLAVLWLPTQPSLMAIALGLQIVLLVLFALGSWVLRPWHVGATQAADRLARVAMIGYGICAVFICGVLASGYLGLRTPTSGRRAPRDLARMQHLGFYSHVPKDAPASLTFTGDRIGPDAVEPRGFQIPLLRTGERVKLEAAATQPDRVTSWKVSTSAIVRPIRLDDLCVNSLPGGWCGPSERYLLVWPAKGKKQRFIELKISGGAKVEYNQGAVADGQLACDASVPVILTQDGVRDGSLLSDLVQSADGFDARWKKASGRALDLATNSAGISGWDVLRGLSLVRQDKGNARSALGLLIDPLVAGQGIAISRNGAALDPAALSAPVVIPAKERSRLTAGVGSGRRSPVIVQSAYTGSGEDRRLEAMFAAPQSYGLPPVADIPPKKALLLSSGEDQVPMDGYTFATGNQNHPFYAKAVLQTEGRSIDVQDGASKSLHPAGEAFSLGDSEQGVLVRLESLASHTEGAGWRTILILAAVLTGFVVVVWRVLPEIRPAHVAWVALWGAALVLLTVRLVLAYRVALAPPDDANAGVLLRYRSALPMALDALLLVPLVILGGAWIAHSERITKAFAKVKGRWYLILPAVACLVPFLAVLSQSRDELFGIVRTSIAVHVLLAIGFAGLAVDLNRRTRQAGAAPLVGWALPVFAALCIAAILSLVVVIGDAGSGLYLIPVLVTLGSLWTPVRARGQRRAPALKWTAVAVVAGVLTLIGLLVFNRGMLLQRFPSVDNTIVHRLASFDNSESKLLLDPDRVERLSVAKVANNSQQRWQMLLYASTGASPQRPAYAGSVLTDDGMTYPTMLSDCAYAVFLLGEHGPLAAILVTGLFVVLMAALLVGATNSYDDGSWAFIPLVFIGVFYATHGLYIAGANVGAFFFTGQNVPLLSLASWGDILQSLILLPLATILMLHDPGRVGQAPPPRGRGWDLLAWSTLGAAGLAWLFVAWHAFNLPARLTQDYQLDPAVAQVMRDRVRRGELVLRDTTIDASQAKGLTPIEREYIRKFNLSPDKTNSDGPYSLDLNSQHKYEIRVNTAAFHITSPYRQSPGVAWRGSILAAGGAQKGEPRLYLLSNPLSLSLDAQGLPKVAYLDAKEPVRGANAAILAARGGRGSSYFAEVASENGVDGPGMAMTPVRGSSWAVYLNGQPLKAKARLAPNDIVVIEDRSSGFPRRYNLIYLGNQPAPLAFVRWRNGSFARTLMPGNAFALAGTLGQAGDEAKAKGDLQLTIDARLHRTLQDAVRNWVKEPAQRALGFDPERPDAKDASLTLIDTFSGELLAMPSAPAVDLTRTDLGKLLAETPANRRWRYFANWNLTNHVIGSTIKPLTFSAVASGLRGELNLESLVVHEREAYHDNIGGLPFGDERGPYGPVGDHDMHEYLTMSRTWPAVVTGSLGLVHDKHGVWNILKPAASGADVTYGKPFRLDLKNSQDRIAAQDERRRDRWVIRPSAQDTVLFRGLHDLFDARIGDAEDDRKARVDSFLPLFLDGASQESSSLDRSLPQPVEFDPSRMERGPDDLRVFLIGGGQSLWNNVAMAQSFARLSTGQYVYAHLEAGMPTPPFRSLPIPLNQPEWREANLFGPLERAHQVGTSRFLRSSFGPYRAIVKTGTLGEDIDSESLMFTIGKSDGRGSFVRGQTVTGYLFLRDSNIGGAMRKFNFADRLLPTIIRYLDSRAGLATRPVKKR